MLLFNHNGFSNQNANGMTMKAFLSAWSPEDKARFYYGTEKTDFSCCLNKIWVTDMDMLKAFFGKKSQYVFNREERISQHQAEPKQEERKAEVPKSLKKHKYNFALKWLREILRMFQPWGKKDFLKWVKDFGPDYVVYMVGESISMDKILLETLKYTGAKLVLYNGKAYCIIDLSKRKGIERLYPKRRRQFVGYDTAIFDTEEYIPSRNMNITYFGNAGDGRMESLFEIADVFNDIDPKQVLHIYGRAGDGYFPSINARKNVNYHGMVGQEVLSKVKNKADILLCV